MDLNGDGVDDFVMLRQGGGPVYQQLPGHHWKYAGWVDSQGPAVSWQTLQDDLSKARARALPPPKWRDLGIGAKRFSIRADAQ